MLLLSRVTSATSFPKDTARAIVTDTDVFWLKVGKKEELQSSKEPGVIQNKESLEQQRPKDSMKASA